MASSLPPEDVRKFHGVSRSDSQSPRAPADTVTSAIEIIERQIRLLEDILRQAPDRTDPRWDPRDIASQQACQEWADETAQLLRIHVSLRAADRFLQVDPLLAAGGEKPFVRGYLEHYGGHLKALHDRIRRSPETVFPHPDTGVAGRTPTIDSKPEISGKPRMFIGSSAEGLSVAQYLQAELDRDAECTIWNQGVFGLSLGGLESLLKATNTFAFAVLVLTPDDVTTKRSNTGNSPRDNVLFELGLFLGALGRERTFIVH